MKHEINSFHLDLPLALLLLFSAGLFFQIPNDRGNDLNAPNPIY